MSFYFREVTASQEQSNDDFINLRIGAGVIYQNSLYFTEKYVNGLFRMNLETQQVEFLRMFTKESGHFLLFRDAYLYENEAWFIPWKGSYIVKVDLDTLTMEYFDMPFHTVTSPEQHKLAAVDFTAGLPAYSASGLLQNRYIFLIPSLYDTVLIIDMKEKTIYPYYDIVDTEKELFTYGCAVEHELWMYPYNGVRLIKLNLKTGEKEYYEWDYPRKTFSGMEYVNGNFWFSPDQVDYVLKMSKDMRHKEKLPLPPQLKKGIRHGIVKYEEKFWLVPSKVKGLISIDYNTKRLETWDTTVPDLPLGFRKISCHKHLALAGLCCVLIWSPSQNTFHELKLKIRRKELLEKLFEELKEKDNPLDYFTDKSGMIVEEYVTLESYLKAIENVSMQCRTVNCGERIWGRLRGDL